MQPTKEPIVAESFDEVVFTDPKEFFYQQLIRISSAPKMQSTDPEVQACYKRYSDEDDFQKLLEAQNFLNKELAQVKERLKMVNEDLEQVDRALIEVQETKKAAAASSRAAIAPVKTSAGVATAPATAPAAKKAKVVPSSE
jgi:deoxyribose-phosphate aldolase